MSPCRYTVRHRYQQSYPMYHVSNIAAYNSFGQGHNLMCYQLTN